jgi:hypothetical protein
VGSSLDWGASARPVPQLGKQGLADGTSDDEDEERGHASILQNADEDLDCDSMRNARTE